MEKALKWHVLGGGFLAYMFDAVEISVLAISLPSIRRTVGLSLFEGGMLATAGWIGIGASGLAMGIVADTYGRRRALLMSLAVFGAATFAFAFSGSSFLLMLFLRLLAGLGLGGVWAILAAYVAETWPAEFRGRATLWVLSSYPVGAVLAAAIGGYLLPDWRGVFMWCGAAAIIPMIYIFLFIPESPVWVADRLARNSNVAQHSEESRSAPILEIFRGDLLRQTVFGTVAATFALFAYIGLLTWLPSYLAVERGLSLVKVSHYVIVFNIGVFVSYFLFGLVADAFGERTALVVSLTGASVMLLIYSMITDSSVLLWISPLMGVFIVFSGLLGSYFSQLYPIHIRATGAGFCFNVGRAIASFSPLLTARIATSVSLSFALMVCAAIFLLSAASVLCLPKGVGRSKLPLSKPVKL